MRVATPIINAHTPRPSSRTIRTYQRGNFYGLRTHSPTRLAAMHQWLRANDRPSPYTSAISALEEDGTTTRVEVSEHLAIAPQALPCHASQVDPDDPWFFSVPVEVMRQLYPFDDYQLLATRQHPHTERYETDLLDGI